MIVFAAYSNAATWELNLVRTSDEVFPWLQHRCDTDGLLQVKVDSKMILFLWKDVGGGEACSNLLIFMLQQSATHVSQLKTVARLRRRRKSETLWGMMKGWKSVTDPTDTE